MSPDAPPPQRRLSGLESTTLRLLAVCGVIATLFAVVEIAMSGYSVMAYNTQTSQFDLQGSLLAEQVIAQFDTLYDYTLGFGDKLGFDATIEASQDQRIWKWRSVFFVMAFFECRMFSLVTVIGIVSMSSSPRCFAIAAVSCVVGIVQPTPPTVVRLSPSTYQAWPPGRSRAAISLSTLLIATK